MGYELILGDALEKIKNLPDESIDLIVTSPPYFNSAKKYQRNNGFHYSMDVGEPLYTIEDASKLLLKKLKSNGFFCLNLGFSYGETGIMRPFYIAERLLKQGWFAIDMIIWHKNNPIPLKDRLTNAIEYIFVFAKQPAVKYPNSIGYKHNVLNCSIAKSEGFSSAPFPVELPEFCLKVFSKENDTILDPFMGSGTTGVACIKLNRKFIGMDINPAYIDLSKKRIEECGKQKTLYDKSA